MCLFVFALTDDNALKHQIGIVERLTARRTARVLEMHLANHLTKRARCGLAARGMCSLIGPDEFQLSRPTGKGRTAAPSVIIELRAAITEPLGVSTMSAITTKRRMEDFRLSPPHKASRMMGSG
jgi:hypothetical protein